MDAIAQGNFQDVKHGQHGFGQQDIAGIVGQRLGGIATPRDAITAKPGRRKMPFQVIPVHSSSL
jgi:hypothetical protein